MMLSKNLQKTAFGFLSRWLAPSLLKGIYRSSRIQVEGREHFDGLQNRGSNYILAFWHGQMLPLLSFFQGRGLYTFISPHRDGEYIARALEGMGNHCVRTSLRDQRLKALGRAIKLTKAGESLAVTPDGPIGPGFQAKPGIVKLSEKVEVPILPAVALPSRAKFFSSWDHFCLPLPLGKIQVRFQSPMKYWEQSLDLSEKQDHLQNLLNTASRDLAEEVLPDPEEYMGHLPES